MGLQDKIWQNANTIGIAVTIVILFIILFITSSGFSKFGFEQQIIMGFIVLLLLFRFIKKIKIGTVLEVELKEVIQSAESILTKLENATQPAVLANTAQLTTQMNVIKIEIKEAKEKLDLLSKINNVY